jgi:hypothetical protein
MHALGAIQVSLMGQTITQSKVLDEFPVYGEWVVHSSSRLGEKGWSVL